MPRAKKQEVDSREFSGQTRQAVPAAEGTLGFDTEPIQVVDGPKAMDMATALAHAEDKLVIVIMSSGDTKNEENPVYVGVNGRGCYIWRNQETIVPRKYVERLLRAQSDSISQDVTAREEKDFNKLNITPAQRYPVTIRKDPDPNGAEWLRQIVQQA